MRPATFYSKQTWLWRDAHRFEEGTSFIAWAFRVAYFMVLEHREKSQRLRRRFRDTVLDSLAEEAQFLVEDDTALSRQCVYASSNCLRHSKNWCAEGTMKAKR